MLASCITANKNFSFGDDDPNNIEQQRTLQLVETIKRSNPDWNIKIWTDEECHALMRKHFPDFYDTWTQKLSPRLKMWDAVRPAILYAKGGLYLDHDIECDEGVHFSNWLRPETTLLLREPTSSNKKLGNHFMGSKPKHPLWKLYIKNIVEEIPLNLSVGIHTGPRQLYPTFQEYLMSVTEEERATIRLLALNEVDTKGECERAEEYEGYCSQPRCSHTHTISPAELAGEDDNPDKQILEFKNKLAAPNYAMVKCTCRRLTKYISNNNTTDSSNAAIFIHIPKTGGTTIEGFMGFNSSCHASATDMRHCKTYGAAWEKALKITTLRHPVERAISLYRYARSGGNGKSGDLIKYNWVQNVSFHEFVDSILSQDDVMFAPQNHFIFDSYNKTSLLVDEILCTEHLESDWKKLVNKYPFLSELGPFPRKRLRVTPLSNTTTPLLVNEVGNATVAKLREVYSEDFELWRDYCGNQS
jgi:hypothetical protein